MFTKRVLNRLLYVDYIALAVAPSEPGWDYHARRLRAVCFAQRWRQEVAAQSGVHSGIRRVPASALEGHCSYTVGTSQRTKKAPIARAIKSIYNISFNTLFVNTWRFICWVFNMTCKLCNAICHAPNIHFFTPNIMFCENSPLSLGCHFWEIYIFSELVILLLSSRSATTKMCLSTVEAF